MKQQCLQWLRTLHNYTMHGVCSGVSESHNEVASRIRFLAKFRRPKTAVLGIFTVLLLGVAIFCLGGNNPIITAGASNSPIATPTASTQPVATATATPTATATAQPTATKTPIETTYTTWQADLLHDGDNKTETILWDDIAFTDTQYEPIYVQTANETARPPEHTLWQSKDSQSISTSHAGHISYNLYSDETGDYLFRYSELWSAGSCGLSFDVFYLSETGEEIVVDSDSIEILADGMPYNDTMNDVERVVEFMERVTSYATHSYVLVSTLDMVDYYDPLHDSVVERTSLQYSTADAPLQVIPFHMLAYFSPQQAELPEDTAPSDILREKMEELNEIRANNYAQVLAAK